MSELPRGWEVGKLSKICSIQSGVGFPRSFQGLKEGTYPVYKVGDVSRAYLHNKGLLTKAENYVSNENALEMKGKLFPKGATLFAKIGEALNLNRRVLVEQEGLADNNVMGVISDISENERYIYRFLQSFRISELSRSTTVPSVRKTDLEEIELPIPPLNEQIRIANKLDSLLTKVDAAQARLEQIPTLLKRFRQSVLAAATSGELTREWRDNQDANWQLTLLKNVASGFNYGSSAKSKPEGDVPVLRMGNLQGGNIDWGNLVFTSDEVEIEKYILEPGDVLFNRTNSPELVGKTSIYRGEQKAIYAGYLIRIRGTELLDSEYLNIQLNSPHARDYCWQVKTDGVSQSNINAKKIQAYQFELPSIKEQKEIVRRVESLFALADVVEKQYLEAKQRVDRLTQSLLAKAFRGELVPQDPNDEPASELLKRIQAEREALAATKPVRKTRRKPVQKSHS